MKLIATLFLLFFISFLITPLVVTLLDDNCDTCIFEKISDEEDSIATKEILINPYHSYIVSDFLLKKIITSNLILSENLSKHDNVSKKIVTPPPDCA